MTEQLQLRRGTASQVSAFTGAQGEVVVDTTNNRAVVSDGSTVGGWSMAKLAEVITNSRTTVSDVAYSTLAADRLVAYVALTAARVVTVPAAAAYPTGTRLTIQDETGMCSPTKSITVDATGSDTIDGAASFVIAAAYGGLEIESNGSNAWTVLSPRPNLSASLVGVGTAPDANNPLSVYGPAALFNGATSMNVTINKAAAADTASLIFEDGFSGRAQVGLNGSDNFSFKVSPDGSAWTTAIAIDAKTGASAFSNMRTPIGDANYSALVTDRDIAFTAITAARTVTLPAAANYPVGVSLIICDESGAVSVANSLTIRRSGSDVINQQSSAGATSLVLNSPFGFARLISNGSSAWTLAGGSPQAPLTVRSETNPNAVGAGSIVIAGNVNKERQEIQSSVQPQFQGYLCGTSVDAPTAVQLGGALFALVGSGFNGATRPTPLAAAIIRMAATENWTTTANGVCITFGTTPNGSPTSAQTERMRIDNTGNVGIGTTTPGCALDVDGLARAGSFTVAALPSGVVGAMAYASNGRKVGEGAGVGTGVLVVYSNSAWRRLSDDTAVAA